MDEHFDPYKTTDTVEIPLKDRLLAQQNLTATIVGSVIGVIPAILLYLFLLSFAFYSIFAYALPGVIVGLFASFIGRGIDRIHRFVAGAVMLGALLMATWWFRLDTSILLFSLVNVVLAVTFASRRLNREEEDALFDYKIGLDRPKS